MGKTTLDIGVASTVLSFKDGAQGLLPVFSKMGIEPGHFTSRGLKTADATRIKSMNLKNTEPVKKRRKNLRAKGNEREGEVYASGAF